MISISIICYKSYNIKIFIAIIYPFNVGVMKNLQQEANKKKILIRPYNVIYKLIEDVKKEINKKLPPVDAEEVIGERSINHNNRKFDLELSFSNFSYRRSKCIARV